MDEGKRGGIALGEQRKEEVFAVVEACVRMLLLSLVQRETEAPGGGEAGGGRGGVGEGGGGEQGGREDAGAGSGEGAESGVDCHRYASVSRSLYLLFRISGDAWISKMPRWLHPCA